MPDAYLDFREAAAKGDTARMSKILQDTAGQSPSNKLDIINSKGPISGKTALHQAVIRDEFEVVQLLLGFNANTYSRDIQDKAPSDYASGRCKQLLEEHARRKSDEICRDYSSNLDSELQRIQQSFNACDLNKYQRLGSFIDTNSTAIRNMVSGIIRELENSASFRALLGPNLALWNRVQQERFIIPPDELQLMTVHGGAENIPQITRDRLNQILTSRTIFTQTQSPLVNIIYKAQELIFRFDLIIWNFYTEINQPSGFSKTKCIADFIFVVKHCEIIFDKYVKDSLMVIRQSAATPEQRMYIKQSILRMSNHLKWSINGITNRVSEIYILDISIIKGFIDDLDDGWNLYNYVVSSSVASPRTNWLNTCFGAELFNNRMDQRTRTIHINAMLVHYMDKVIERLQRSVPTAFWNSMQPVFSIIKGNTYAFIGDNKEFMEAFPLYCILYKSLQKTLLSNCDGFLIECGDALRLFFENETTELVEPTIVPLDVQVEDEKSEIQEGLRLQVSIRRAESVSAVSSSERLQAVDTQTENLRLIQKEIFEMLKTRPSAKKILDRILTDRYASITNNELRILFTTLNRLEESDHSPQITVTLSPGNSCTIHMRHGRDRANYIDRGCLSNIRKMFNNVGITERNIDELANGTGISSPRLASGMG